MKKLTKQGINLAKTGIVLGVGATTITASGGSPAALSSISRSLPTMGGVMGATATIRALKELETTKRRN